MLLQMLLLPLYLLLFIGPDVVSAIDPAPFVEALVVLIIIPLAAAALTQALARRLAAGQGIIAIMQALMVPLYTAFLLVMVPLWILAAKPAHLDSPATRAVVFSGATRNSLALAALVVVAQTLVELIGLVLYVRFLPVIIRNQHRRQPT